MANGHVEIYDPISNNNNDLTDPKCTSDADNMEDTVELRILMAYAKRRRPKKRSFTPMGLETGGTDVTGPSSPQTPAKTEKERKKKKKGLKLHRIFMCIKPPTKDEEPPQNDANNRCFVAETERKEEDELEEIADRLTDIADEIPFIPPPPPELETDSPEDEDVEKVIGLLLRDVGDKVNTMEAFDSAAVRRIFWNYSFFERLITTLLTRMGFMTDPDTPGPKASPKAHIAVTCEAASRLSALDTLPMSRMLNFGARYLQQHYSSWAQQQGGYEAAFHSDDDEDEVQ